LIDDLNSKYVKYLLMENIISQVMKMLLELFLIFFIKLSELLLLKEYPHSLY